MVRGPLARATEPALCTQHVRWDTFDAAYLITRSQRPGELTLRYRADEASRRVLEALVVGERGDRRSVTCVVRDEGEALTVVVCGSPEALDAWPASD